MTDDSKKPCDCAGCTMPRRLDLLQSNSPRAAVDDSVDLMPRARCTARWTHAVNGEEHWCQLIWPHTADHRDGDATFPSTGAGMLAYSQARQRELAAETDAIRATAAARAMKAPLDRLGEIPRAIRALASQIAYGSAKDGRTPGDWRQLTREELLAKALRHLLDAATGEMLDADGRSHLVAAMTNCAFAVELEGKEPS